MKIILKTYSIIIVIGTIIFSGCQDKSETVETGEPHHNVAGNMVELNAAQYSIANIELGSVEQRNISRVIKVNGVLEAPPQSLVSISSIMGGFVKDTNLLHGSRINEGDIVVSMEHPDYIHLQLDYLESKSKLVYLEQEFERQKGLREKNVSSLKTFQKTTADYKGIRARVNALEQTLALIGINAEQLEETKKISRSISIRSPITGYVSEVNVNIGKYVNPADVMFEIVNTEHLHAELTLFEKDINKIREGQKIRFTLPNEDDKERLAFVYLIGRSISEARTVKVHGHLDKEDDQLLPGMFVKARIEIAGKFVTSLPEQAIVHSDGENYIFILASNMIEHNQEVARFEMIKIHKGVTDGPYAEVVLPDNFNINSNQIVLKGAYTLLSKMKVSGEEDGHGH
ncbi:MAG: efflux RND transporter periplasmic adaptor subunit [Planctomycetes bacterium]|nr:efflux RND transporter periplasmic adaptor subunit [Planctomycetota bacterium]